MYWSWQVVLNGNKAAENDDNDAASEHVEDMIGEEIEKSEKHSTI